ncbi:MAG: RadC family protein [Methanoculleaceae archaeon]
MSSFKNIPQIDRPREKIVRVGAQALSDTELIAAIIGGGTRNRDVLKLATDIIRKTEGKLTEATYETLTAIPGVGEARACQLLAAIELGRRQLAGTHVKISKPEDVLPFLQEIRNKKQEYFLCISLNGAGEVIESRVVTVGLLNFSPIHPREVFADPIGDRAASVILAHNHPSGTLEPSSQDIEITRRLVEAGNLLGIRVHDHIIVTKTGYLSMKARGLM